MTWLGGIDELDDLKCDYLFPKVGSVPTAGSALSWKARL
jgi:hypothetical protein